MTDPKKVHAEELSEEPKKTEINFPCGNLEEMLRMFKRFAAKENLDCGEMIRHFIDKESKNICAKDMLTEMRKTCCDYARKRRT